MLDPEWRYPLLAASAFAAGVVNSVAGGGTLLTFPALLASGIPGINANATSTTALMPGSVAGAFGFRHELGEQSKLVRLLMAPSIIGAVIGTLLVTRLPESVFDALVPWLVLGATMLFLLQKPLVRALRLKADSGPTDARRAGMVVFQFFVAVYGGYFGAGIGIVTLAALGMMGLQNVHQMNAVKTLLAVSINCVSVMIFTADGRVFWPEAGVMAVAAVCGGYLGARVSRRLPQGLVRAIVGLVGLVVAATTFWK